MNISIAWRTTCASLNSNMAIVMLLIYLGVAFATAVTYWQLGTAKTAEILVLMAGVSAIIWWASISSTSLKILRDADKLMIPAVTKAVVSALILQAVLTIIIPSALCALLGRNLVVALATFTAFAASGLLIMLLPRYLGMSLVIIPSVLDKLEQYKLIPTSGSDGYSIFISILAASMTAIALWRLNRLRHFDGDIHSWRSPMALLPDGANIWGVSNGLKLDTGQLLTSGIYYEPAVQVADIGSPKLALLTYLGLPFMPLTSRSQYKQFFLVGIFYVFFISYYVFDIFKDEKNDSPIDTVMAVGLISVLGLGFTFSAALMRLQALYSKDNAELAELALLPGWENVQNARSLLLTVIAQHIGRALLLPVSATFIAVIFIPSESNSGYFLVALFIITSILLAAGYGLYIISGKKPWPWLLGFVFVSLPIFYFIQIALFSIKSPESAHSWPSILTWAAFLLFAIPYFTFAWRSFQNREHPFLRN